jgi:hypothetical protein
MASSHACDLDWNVSQKDGVVERATEKRALKGARRKRMIQRVKTQQRGARYTDLRHDR